MTVRDDDQPYDAVTLPRQVFLEIYKHRIIKKIVEQSNNNITWNNVFEHFTLNRFNSFDKIINNAINEIIEKEDLIVIINRNPSLKLDSLIGMRVDSVWDEETMRIPKVILPLIAGDFDGDSLAIFPIFTQEAKEEVKNTIMITSRALDIYGFSSFNYLLSPFEDNNVGIYLLDNKHYKEWLNNK